MGKTTVRLLILFTTRIPGGADMTYGAPIVAEAMQRGWDVHTACSARTEMRPLANCLEQLGAKHHSCELVEKPYGRLQYGLMAWCFCARTRNLIETVKPDRVLLVLPYMTYGLGIMRACRDAGIPTVTVFQLVKPQVLRPSRSRAMRELLAEHCQPVAVSDNNRKILCGMFGMTSEQIELIYNGARVSEVSTTSSSERNAIRSRIRQELDLPADIRILLTAARLAPQKRSGSLPESLYRKNRNNPPRRQSASEACRRKYVDINST